MVTALREQYPEIESGNQIVRRLREAWPEIYDDLDWFRRIPDAAKIDAAAREVDLEIEVTHAIERGTIDDLCKMWSILDSLGIDLHLFVVSRYGHINELDVVAWHLRFLRDTLEENRP